MQKYIEMIYDSVKRKTHRWGYWVILIILGWYICSVILYPLQAIICDAFCQNGVITLEAMHTALLSKRVLRATVTSLLIGIISVVIAYIIGVFQLLVLEYFEIKYANILRLGYYLSIVFCGVSLVTSYAFVYSSNGFVTEWIQYIIPIENYWFSGITAVCFVNAFTLTNFQLIYVSRELKNIDQSVVEDAVNLGISPIKAFFSVIIPALKPSMLTATILVFVQAISANTAPTILGGKGFSMLSTMIKSLRSAGHNDLAAFLALILGVFTLALITVANNYIRVSNYASTSKVKTLHIKYKIQSKPVQIIVSCLAWLLFVLYVFPFATVFLYSFADIQAISGRLLPLRLSFDNYMRVFSNHLLFKPVFDSLKISTIAIIFVLCISFGAAYIVSHNRSSLISRAIDHLLCLPWCVPIIVYVIGLLSAYSKKVFLVGNQVLIGTEGILIMGYTIVVLPMIYKAMLSMFLYTPRGQEEAALGLGASRFKYLLSIFIPQTRHTMLSIIVIAYITLLTEYTVSELLHTINIYPLGVAFQAQFINNQIEHVANALVYIVFINVVTFVPLLFLELIEKRKTKIP